MAMPAKKYRVRLSEEERQELKGLVSRGRTAAYRQTHARILLLSDEVQGNGAMRDEDIARSLQIGSATVERVRRRCVEEGIEAALGRREQLNRRQKKLDGSGEAHLIAAGLCVRSLPLRCDFFGWPDGVAVVESSDPDGLTVAVPDVQTRSQTPSNGRLWAESDQWI